MSVAQTQASSWKRPFFTIWSGQAASLLGSSLVQFALIWWLTQRTGSATVLATASLVGLLPGVFLGPFAGALVDRWNRRTVMIVADGVVALASAYLAVLYWVGAMQVWHIYVIMFIRALGGSFHWPAMQASTSLMVPEKQLSRVAGLNQTLQGAMGIVSPPLGALLLGILPLHGIMAIDVTTAALAIGLLGLVHIPQPRRSTPVSTAAHAKPSLWADVAAGMRYVWGWPGLFAVLLMATILNLLINPAMALLPLLVTKHFHGQALQLSWMESGMGLGVVAGGLLLSIWGGFRQRVMTSMLGLCVMGLGVTAIGTASATAFWPAVGAMVAFGLALPICNGPLFAVVQAKVAPDMQGRVFTLMGSASAAMSPLGMIIAGPLADQWGVQIWFVLSGIACLFMAAAGLIMPVIRHLEDRPNAQVAIEQASLGPAITHEG
jgi:MFS transporter, DHA3 family, macrolide efflux protein